MNIGSTAGSAFTSAAYAIDQGSSQVRRAAQDVVSASTTRPVESPGKLAESMTDLKEGEQMVQAGSKVMQAADRQLGSLIDVTA